MNCTCGHTETLEAGSREEAVSMFKAGMTQEHLDSHFEEHHKGEAKPTLEQSRGMIE